jgi:hypothetical protein
VKEERKKKEEKKKKKEERSRNPISDRNICGLGNVPAVSQRAISILRPSCSSTAT